MSPKTLRALPYQLKTIAARLRVNVKRIPLISWAETRGDPGAETLVLLFHGMDCGPETMSSVAAEIKAAIPSSYILIPALPFRWHHCADLKEVGEEVLDHIDASVALAGFKLI